jgi:hypothetical protein
MLSDRDRDTLNEIQHRLMMEDPQFSEAFHLESRGLSGRRRRLQSAALTALIALSLLLSVLMIVVHALGPTLFFAGMGWWLIWLRRTVLSHSRRRDL